MVDCETCDKRKTCVKLCDEAEAYANQDYVSQKELIPRKPVFKKMAPFPTTKSQKELILKLFFAQNYKQAQIAEMLDISQQYVSKIVVKYRKIIAENIEKSIK